MVYEYLKVSFLMMRAKPVRTALSLLGIYIGVMALLVILAIREGIRRQIEDMFRTEGAHVVLIMPGFDAVAKRIGHLTPDDVDQLRSVRGIEAALPRGSADFDVRSDAASLHAHVAGVDAGFVPLYRVPLIRGRTFFPDEVDKKQTECLLTDETARKLFPVAEPVGASIDIKGTPYRVIGVVRWSPAVSQRTSILDADILLPISLWNFDDNQPINEIEARVSQTLSSAQAKELVLRSLTHGDSTRQALFFVRSLEQMLEKNREMSDRILVGLLGIAAISLLVGGIGVANVMVTSVTERTREIGIRKALGARRIDILSQFLIESSVLCASGGILAVTTGAAALMLVHAIADVDIPMILTPPSMAACVALTFGIGLLAGVYPASRAAGLSPAEALRYE